MRRIRHHLLHDILDLGELVHQVDLIMETARRIDENYIRIIGLGASDGIICHAGWIRALLLFYNGHSHTFAPYTELLDSRSTERVSRAEIHFFTSLLVLVC